MGEEYHGVLVRAAAVVCDRGRGAVQLEAVPEEPAGVGESARFGGLREGRGVCVGGGLVDVGGAECGVCVAEL